MTHPAYLQNIETAFEDAVGACGADPKRFAHWLGLLETAIPNILTQPQREAAPLLALPKREDDLAEIEAVAAQISGNFSTLVVAGMGGSSLGGETLVQLRSSASPVIHFLDNIDPHGMDALTRSLPWDDTAFLIISKSGNTVEVLAQMAMLLRGFKTHAAGDPARHFFILTIPNGNALHTLAQTHSMQLIAHDPDLGGRFSVLSNVGLIPARVAGLDIRALRYGANAVLSDTLAPAQGAALHKALMEKQACVNVTMHYCDRLSGLANWYRQCWAESLGKGDHVTTPVRSRGATDQHSQLQLYLGGPKDKFFSMIMLENAGLGPRIDYDGISDPRLEFLSGHTMGDLMDAQQHGTISTLVKRGCPVRSFAIKTLNEEAMGGMLMHFALEVIFAAQLLGVNAFDQPAVEDGKLLALRFLAGK